MRRSIRTATAALAAAGLLATAACGSDDDNGDDSDATGQQGSDDSAGDIIQALQASATEAHDAKTVGMDITADLTDDNGTYTILDLSGTTGWDPVALDMVMDMSGAMDMAADQMGEEPLDDMSMQMQMRLIDDMMYMSTEMFAELSPEVDESGWIGISLEEAAGEDPEMAQLIEQMEVSDTSPTEQIGLLLESDELEEVGEEELDGVATTRYRGTLTTEQLVELEAEQNEYLTDEMLESTREDLAEFGADEATIEIWIDGNDLPVRHDMVMELGTEGEVAELAPNGEVAYSTLYRDWGTTDGLEAPPEGDVMDMEEFEALLAG